MVNFAYFGVLSIDENHKVIESLHCSLNCDAIQYEINEEESEIISQIQDNHLQQFKDEVIQVWVIGRISFHHYHTQDGIEYDQVLEISTISFHALSKGTCEALSLPLPEPVTLPDFLKLPGGYNECNS